MTKFKLRTNKPLTDTKLESLRQFTTLLVEKRGWASEEEVNKFLVAGYTSKNVLELIEGFKWEAPEVHQCECKK